MKRRLAFPAFVLLAFTASPACAPATLDVELYIGHLSLRYDL
jgi:hypothetical protein